MCLLALGNLFCLNCSTKFWWKVSSIHETLAQIPIQEQGTNGARTRSFYLK